MKKIRVQLQNRSYDIVIGRGLLAKVGALIKKVTVGKKVLVVSNHKIAKQIGLLKPLTTSLKRSGFDVSYHELRHGDERDKSLISLNTLWNSMVKNKLDRSSAVVALGGGVTGDVSAFAASTYMRGIRAVQIPTTLLAQVDSAIGGKTGIDLPLGKNLVGTFYQPNLVISDLSLIEYLPLSVVRASMAEIIKCGVIRDVQLFELLEKKGKAFADRFAGRSLAKQDLNFLETVVYRSAKIKALVVERDEHETKGERMILNYGHTFAHALEGVSGYRLPHGEAVGLGMILAARLGVLLGITPTELENRQFRLISAMCPSASLKPLIRSYRLSWSALKPYFFRDKKTLQGVVRFIVPTKLGQVIRLEIKGRDWNLVRSAVESLT